MGFWNKVLELWTNAEDGQLSQARFGIFCMMVMMLIMDGVSLYMMLAGTFQAGWLDPLCTMNSATVASLAVAYYSSNKG